MKKLIVSFVLVILFLSIAGIGMVTASKPNNAQAEKFSLPEHAVEVSPGVYYLGKSMDKGEVVEGYAFVHYAKSALNSRPVLDSTVDIYKLMYGGIKWNSEMTYEVNTNGGIFSGTGDVMSILGASLETWDEQTTFDIFASPSTLNNIATPGEDDGQNIVVWDYLGDSGAIAYNVFWYNKATKEILDSDVVFNTYYTWNTDNECSGGMMDLQSIATHEFGHNGLNDLYMLPSVELTMHGFSYGYCETHKRDLGTGDISGIKALYGD